MKLRSLIEKDKLISDENLTDISDENDLKEILNKLIIKYIIEEELEKIDNIDLFKEKQPIC